MSKEFEPACRRMEWLDPFYKAVWEKAFAEAIPISGTFELTPRCNFNCRMCYVHLKPEEISRYGRELMAKEWLQIAEEAKMAGTAWLCITGGEPLLHPEFEEIWKSLCQMGFFITLQTNGSLIRGKVIDLLEKYPPKSVKLTLYGSNDKIYNAVCGASKGFTEVDQGIQNLIRMNVPVELVSTVIRQNQADVERMAFYAYRQQLPWRGTSGIKHSVRNGQGEEVKIEKGDLATKLWEREMKKRLELSPIDIERKPCTYCKDYRVGYWITWNGEMHFCSFMDRPCISVLEKGFQLSWRELVEYQERLSWPEECYNCRANKICLKCPGELNAECGEPEKVTERFCAKYKQAMERIVGG